MQTYKELIVSILLEQRNNEFDCSPLQVVNSVCVKNLRAYFKLVIKSVAFLPLFQLVGKLSANPFWSRYVDKP